MLERYVTIRYLFCYIPYELMLSFFVMLYNYIRNTIYCISKVTVHYIACYTIHLFYPSTY